MCNLSWTPYSNLEKDNSLKTTPVLAQRWAVWSILTKKYHEHQFTFFLNNHFLIKNNIPIAMVIS